MCMHSVDQAVDMHASGWLKYSCLYLCRYLCPEVAYVGQPWHDHSKFLGHACLICASESWSLICKARRAGQINMHDA